MPQTAPPLSAARAAEITSRYHGLGVLIAGDFCLDRYFEIDPALEEISLETGLPVHNVVRVRCQPGGAGTIVNNLAALGVGRIILVGCTGDDGEGFELRRALGALTGVDISRLAIAPARRTFCYSKPLVLRPDAPPRELNRLDIKNWTDTPPALARELAESFEDAAKTADALIVLDQSDVPGVGVVTAPLLAAAARAAASRPLQPCLADSRRGLGDWPALSFKMNARELGLLARRPAESLEEAADACQQLANRNRRAAFVTLAERGILAAEPGQRAWHAPALPVRGAIDIVGAGDAVTANLAAALGAGAALHEALRLAMAAAHIVIHQLGTTGAASPEQLQGALS